jgi:FKBP-type peptidyl-prolyl cis-trans isomerase
LFSTHAQTKKILDLSDSDVRLKDKDLILSNLIVKAPNDSILFSSEYGTKKYDIIKFKANSSWDFYNQISSIREGDSIELKLNATSFYQNMFGADLPLFLNYDDSVRVNMRILKIYPADYREFALNKLTDEMEMEELRQFSKFVRGEDGYKPVAGGVFVKTISKGDYQLSFGKLFEMRYGVYFLDGTQVFDNRSKETADAYVYGQKGMFITGLENALKNCSYNDELEVLIHSSEAFGETGSLNGVVPPYTSLIFKLKILPLN